MDGILNVLKPAGMTSFDVVAYLRGLLRIKKIGHTGTLDPGAVGVLPVCIGSATKAIEYISDRDKHYRAELMLGTATDTQDSSGSIISTREIDVSGQQIKECIETFTGRILQIPPMFSAVKVGGKKLYELARKGVTVERKPREVNIYSTSVVNIADNRRVIFDIACSKGTYIRTLCADIGERLGCGGHMSFLVRTRVGGFDIDSALTLEDVEALVRSGKLDEKIEKVGKVFDSYGKIVLSPSDEKLFLNGVFINLDKRVFKSGTVLKVCDCGNNFIAVGETFLRQENLCLKIKKLFK